MMITGGAAFASSDVIKFNPDINGYVGVGTGVIGMLPWVLPQQLLCL